VERIVQVWLYFFFLFSFYHIIDRKYLSVLMMIYFYKKIWLIISKKNFIQSHFSSVKLDHELLFNEIKFSMTYTKTFCISSSLWNWEWEWNWSFLFIWCADPFKRLVQPLGWVKRASRVVSSLWNGLSNNMERRPKILLLHLIIPNPISSLLYLLSYFEQKCYLRTI